MNYNNEVEDIIVDMIEYAKKKNHEYVTPEHFIYMATFLKRFDESFEICGGDISILRADLEKYFLEEIDNNEEAGKISTGLRTVLINAQKAAGYAGKNLVELVHIINEIKKTNESYGAYYLLKQDIEWTEFLNLLSEENSDKQNENEGKSWMEYLVDYNEIARDSIPLVGRENELERTIQILCRKYKNNPLHIGEAGVGKTAIAIGLANLINKNEVPDRLKNSKIYGLDMSTLLAGTQYRGDFEKRFKNIMQGLETLEKPIIYLDEIHNIVGAGAVGEGSFDASNMLKPYLTEGKIRFIGATTYEEYKKYFSKSKSLIRRFQNIDINEPTIDEAIHILEGLKSYYEDYHNVKYTNKAIEEAVKLSDKFINNRFLPDKAIDLIDEAGAYRIINPLKSKIQKVDSRLIELMLSKICNIPKKTVESNEIKKLKTLPQKLESKIFGQNEAIMEAINAIKLSRAGLNDDNKTIANLLFVGPTGVGKTQVAKVLAEELDIKLIRFDMSEYSEKHTVSKLIGAPAGYVGYEEGGLLTTEIWKNPHAVLLLDEIEKAHPDIFNTLLQVMDYATLTDNQGRKVDFKNIILIMTSNAGAKSVGKSIIGFGNRSFTKEAINEEVKNVFSPEFRNRLNKIVIFNDLDDEMADAIVKKEINQLKQKVKLKNISLIFSKDIINYIKEKGITKEYGARQIQRVINNEIKPVLVDKILFAQNKGKLSYRIGYKEDKISIIGGKNE